MAMDAAAGFIEDNIDDVESALNMVAAMTGPCEPVITQAIEIAKTIFLLYQ